MSTCSFETFLSQRINNKLLTKNLEKYFKITDVKTYELTVVDEMGESTEGFMDTAMSTITVILFVIKIFFI